MNNEIIYEIPKWGIRLLILVVSAMALGFVLLGATYDTWSTDSPTWFKYFFYVISFFASVSTYRLISWRRWIYFKANTLGMSFPCPKLKECDSEYLFIPWANIKNIKVKKFLSTAGSTTNGVSIDVKVSLKNRNQYFPELLFKEYSEWTAIGFTDAFLKKKATASQLTRLKSQCI